MVILNINLSVVIYKACRNSIVTLKLLNDSVTNEKRKNVFDDKYAKFRCDKAKVINITNVETGEMMNSDISLYIWRFKYTLGEIIETVFNTNIDEVCAEGIHYFKTKKAALSWFYRRQNKPDGKWTDWRENGQKHSEGSYKNGKRNGKWIYWRENGKKEEEGTYKNGEKDGKWIKWHNNGQKFSEGSYKENECDGKWTGWWDNGNKHYEGTYKDGDLYGECEYWYETGMKQLTLQKVDISYIYV